MRQNANEQASTASRRKRTDLKAGLAAYGGTPIVRKEEIVPWPAARRKHVAPLAAVVDSGKYHRVNHPMVTDLERDLARWSGHWDVRAVGSGTSAIHIELDYFRQRGEKVVTAALNWPGAVGPIAFSGMCPEFVDVDLTTASVDEGKATERLGEGCGALLVTHLFGGNVMVPRLRAAARRHGIAIIDDVCQSIAAVRRLQNGRPLDSDALALSGNGAKHLGAGEIGFVLARDPDLIDHVDKVSLTSSARNGERVFSPSTLGYNYRPNVFSAALAGSRIAKLDQQLDKRRRNATYLWRSIGKLDGLAPLFDPADAQHSFLNLPMRLDTDALGLPAGPEVRDLVVELLKAEGVPVWIWLTKPVFEYLPAWRDRWSASDFPNTQKLLDTMFYVSEIAPPNDAKMMRSYAEAFEKVWDVLPALLSETKVHDKRRGH